jgi:LemA protein
MTALLLVLAVLALLAGWVVLAYNGLVAARERTDLAWRGVDAQLRRRHDAAAAVRDPEVEAALRAAGAAAEPFARVRAERRLAAALAACPAPTPAALAAVEQDLLAARRAYNADVRLYLARKRRFPTAVVAGLGDFRDRAYFELDARAAR